MSASGNQQKHESTNPIQRALIGRFHAAVLSMLELAKPKDLLDLGCGEGFVLHEIVQAQRAIKLHGIDLSESAVSHARARLQDNATIEQEDARTLVKDGRSFDLVMMLEVLEHIPEPEQMLPVLENLTRQYLLLSVPQEPAFRALNFLRGKNMSRWGNDIEHVNHWSSKSFRRFIEQRFEVMDMPSVFPWTMILARKRT